MAATEIEEVLLRVTDWSAEQRLELATQILLTLKAAPAPARSWPLDRIGGLLATDGPAPVDAECDRIVEEERSRKYGPCES